MIGHWEILLIVVVAILVLFGATKIKTFMRSLGEGVKEFKEGLKSPPQKQEEQKPAETPPSEEKPKQN